MIQKGQRVVFKPEYQDVGDAKVEWRAVEDEDGGRVLVVAVNLNLTIPPSQVVKTEWLRETGHDREFSGDPG